MATPVLSNRLADRLLWRVFGGRWLIGVMLVLGVATSVTSINAVVGHDDITPLSVLTLVLFVLGGVGCVGHLVRPSRWTFVASGLGLSGGLFVRGLTLLRDAVHGTHPIGVPFDRMLFGVVTFIFASAAILVAWMHAVAPTIGLGMWLRRVGREARHDRQ